MDPINNDCLPTAMRVKNDISKCIHCYHAAIEMNQTCLIGTVTGNGGQKANADLTK